MIVTYTCRCGEQCSADVKEVGFADEDPRSAHADSGFDIRWLADCGQDQREMDNEAVAAFLEASP